MNKVVLFPFDFIEKYILCFGEELCLCYKHFSSEEYFGQNILIFLHLEITQSLPLSTGNFASPNLHPPVKNGSDCLREAIASYLHLQPPVSSLYYLVY